MAAEDEVKRPVSRSFTNASVFIRSESVVSTKNSFWKVDRRMIRFKLHYLLFTGALGAVLPYMTIFAQGRIGMSPTSIATMLTTQQVLFIFSKPLMGYLADYFKKMKAFLAILMIIQGICFFSLLTLPRIDKTEYTKQYYSETNCTNHTIQCAVASESKYFSHNVTNVRRSYIDVMCHDNVFETLLNGCFQTSLYHSGNFASASYTNASHATSYLDNIYKNISFLSLRVDLDLINISVSISQDLCTTICCDTIKNCSIEFHVQNVSGSNPRAIEISDFETYQFWLFAILNTFGFICINAMFTLSDTILSESAQKLGSDFGRQRLWGAVGWGIGAPIGGFLNDYTDDYLATWCIMAILSAISLWNVCKLDLVEPKFSQNILKDVGKVLRSKGFLVFEFGMLMNGIAVGAIWFYLVWFLTTIGGSRLLGGLVQTVQCFVGEIPFMFFSGWVLKKVGHFNCLTMAMLAYCIRFLWYSQLHNPWLILPMEIAHGFTYGLFYPAAASYATLSAKPGTEATTQAILFTTHEGLGAAIGVILSGVGIDYLGGHRTFFIGGVFMGCGTLLNIIATLFVHRSRKTVVVTS